MKKISRKSFKEFVGENVESRLPGSILKVIHNNNFKKVIKIVCLLMLGAILQASFSSDINLKEHESIVNGMQETIDSNQKTLTAVISEKDDLKGAFQKLEEQTKEYISLSQQEKEIVDGKIQEVKQATADQLAKEQAEKKEAERVKKEQEEAKIKAEEEARAKAEEEARKVEEQKKLENANCIKTAKQYINYTAFSREGLIHQLEYEGYSTESAEYSVDSLSIDWNAQCAKMAKQYLDYTGFSRDGLYDQLQYEGFSNEQIEYGLSQVGY